MRMILPFVLFINGNIVYAQGVGQQSVSTNYILTSTLLAAFVSAGVSALISVVLKNKEYKNDYNKKIIDKRIKSIESIEVMFALINPSVIDINDPNRNYPVYFKENIGSGKFQELVGAISAHSLWISRSTRNTSNNLVAAILKMEHKALKLEGRDRVMFLMGESEQLIDLKINLQKSMAEDMRNMHNVNSFFKLRFYSKRSKIRDMIEIIKS